MELTSITKKSYNEIPYTSNVYRMTLPVRQKSILKLLGFNTPDLENARVLEIGCSFGGNILSFAMAFPNSECIGIDLSETQISEGNKIIEQLGVKNLKLYAKNILEYNNEFGKFDYIVVHGVFSWIPDIVKEKILEVIRDGLSKNGSAVISYNTYPGWKKHEILRDLMCFRLDYLKEKGMEISEEDLVNYANGTLEFLKEHGSDGLYYKDSALNILNYQSYYVRHEHLEENNDPMYLCDFEKMANKYNLSHICDSNLAVTFPSYTEEIIKNIELESLGDNIVKEQYYDYLSNKQFRISIITHTSNKSKISINRNFFIDNLKELFISADGISKKNEDGLFVLNSAPYDESFNVLLEYLNEIFPNNVKISQIVEDLKDSYEDVDLYAKILELIIFKLVLIAPFKISTVKVNLDKPKIKEVYKNYFKYRTENDAPLINCGDLFGNVLLTSKEEAFALNFFDGTKTLDELAKYLIEETEKNESILGKVSSIEYDSLMKDLKILSNYCYNHHLLEKSE